ncbi:MAG: hypothetical protein WCO25_06275 [Candidatus Uhrbacteria bacterium]
MASEKTNFKIISIEPNEHRLGLSLKALSETGSSAAEAKEDKEEKIEVVVAEAVAETKKEEVAAE